MFAIFRVLGFLDELLPYAVDDQGTSIADEISFMGKGEEQAAMFLPEQMYNDDFETNQQLNNTSSGY